MWMCGLLHAVLQISWWPAMHCLWLLCFETGDPAQTLQELLRCFTCLVLTTDESFRPDTMAIFTQYILAPATLLCSSSKEGLLVQAMGSDPGCGHPGIWSAAQLQIREAAEHHRTLRHQLQLPLLLHLCSQAWDPTRGIHQVHCCYPCSSHMPQNFTFEHSFFQF